jgi:hypothetical protein
MDKTTTLDTMDTLETLNKAQYEAGWQAFENSENVLGKIGTTELDVYSFWCGYYSAALLVEVENEG